MMAIKRIHPATAEEERREWLIKQCIVIEAGQEYEAACAEGDPLVVVHFKPSGALYQPARWESGKAICVAPNQFADVDEAIAFAVDAVIG